MSKILEKLIKDRLMNFFDYKIIYDDQYGFRTKHSVVHVLHDVNVQILDTIQNKKQTALLPVAYAGFWKGEGSRNFGKYEKSKGLNQKLFRPKSVRFFAQHQVKSKKKGFHLVRFLAQNQVKSKKNKINKKSLHSNLVRFFAQNQVKSKKKRSSLKFSPISSIKPRRNAQKIPFEWSNLMPNLQRGGIPKFCLLFYAILQSWRPKRGAWHNGPPRRVASGGQCPPPDFFLAPHGIFLGGKSWCFWAEKTFDFGQKKPSDLGEDLFFFWRLPTCFWSENLWSLRISAKTFAPLILILPPPPISRSWRRPCPPLNTPLTIISGH